MQYKVTEESFASLTAQWKTLSQRLRWDSTFVLPAWLQVWWQEFGTGTKPHLVAVRQVEEIIGIAPLLLGERTASFMGSANVCDYLDFIVAPGLEKDFFNVLLDDLKAKGVNQLDLGPVRPDSMVLTSLVTVAEERGYDILRQPEDVSVETDLPATWEEYLELLPGKQRHELRRKLRRLSAEGEVEYRSVGDRTLINQTLDSFLKMFTESRQDKAAFMTAQMESFFHSLVDAMAEVGLTRLGILELDGVPTAMILYFDYNGVIYLYNSGYDPRYEALSVGLLCKALCIKESIETGKKKFDFLKGSENYKYHFGGKEVPLYRVQITIR